MNSEWSGDAVKLLGSSAALLYSDPTAMTTIFQHFTKTLAVIGVVVMLSASSAYAQLSQQQAQGVLKPGVVALPADGSVTLSNITPNSVTLSGKVPALKADEVITGGPAPGIMRRIISISQTGNATTLQTKDAALTDVFQSVSMSFSGTLVPGKPTFDLNVPGTCSNGYESVKGVITKTGCKDNSGGKPCPYMVHATCTTEPQQSP
jgi:hypothetical protein